MRASVDWFPTIVFEAAHPIKFGEALCEALDRGPERHEAFSEIEDLPQRSVDLQSARHA